MTQEGHTLKTQIHADFGKSITSVTKYKQKIEELNNSLVSIATKATDAEDKWGNLSFNFAKRLDDAVKEIREQKQITVDANEFHKKLELAMGNAIAEREVYFKGLVDGKDKMIVNVPDRVAQLLKNNLALEMEKALEKVELQADMLPKIKMTAKTKEALTKRFVESLNQVVDKNLKFDWGRGEDNKKLNKLTLSADDLNKIMSAVRTKVQAHLADPAFVELGELKPLTFSAKAFQDAMDRMQKQVYEAIGELEGQLNFDMDALKKLPNVKDKMQHLKNYTETLLQKIDDIFQGVASLDLKHASTSNFEKLRERIAGIRGTLVKKVHGMLSSIHDEIDGLALDKPDLTLTKTVLEDTARQVDQHITKLVVEAQKALENAFDINTTVNGDGKETKAVSIQKMREAIVKATQEAVAGLDNGSKDLDIDVTKVKQLLRDWSKDTIARLDADMAVALLGIQKELLLNNKLVIDSFKQSISDMVKFNFNGFGPETLVIDLDSPELLARIKAELAKITDNIAKVNITSPGKKAITEGIKITKSNIDDLNNSLKELVETQVKTLADQIDQRKGKMFAEADLENYDKILYNESARLINNVVQQAKIVSEIVADGVGKSGFKSFSAEEQEKIKRSFNDSAVNIVGDYTGMMETALGAFVITSETIKHLKQNLEKELNDTIKRNGNIDFSDEKFPIQLKGVLRLAQQKLQAAVKTNVESWVPELSDFKLKIDFSNFRDPVQAAINQLLNETGKEVSQMVRSVIPDKKGIERPSKIVESVDEPPVRIKSNTLHTDVKKALAEREEMKVKDWAKAFPIIEGDDDIRDIMGLNVAVVMQKFHDKIAKSTDTAIKIYKDEIDKVNVQPNTESVNFLAQQFQKIQDQIAKKIKEMLKAQFNMMVDEIKGITASPSSIGYTPNQTQQKYFVRRPTGSPEADEILNGAQSIGFQYPAVITPDATKLPPGSGTDYTGWDDKRVKGIDFNSDTWGENYIKQGRLDVLKMKNRFRGSMSDQDTTDFFDYLDNNYMSRVKNIASIDDKNDNSMRQEIRKLMRDLALELKMAAEVAKGEQLGERVTRFGRETEGKQADFFLKSENAKSQLRDKLSPDQFDSLKSIFDGFGERAQNLTYKGIYDLGDMVEAKRMWAELNQELKAVVSRYKDIGSENRRELSRDKLYDELDILTKNRIVPQERLDSFKGEIDNSDTNAMLERTRLLLKQIKQEERDLKQNKAAQDRKNAEQERLGTLIASSEILKTNLALQNEHLRTVIKTVPELKSYNIESSRINNSTNTWSIKLKDALGNVKSLSGAVDKATGNLYQHSEALSLVARKEEQLDAIRSRTGFKYANQNVSGPTGRAAEYNPNGNFMTSVTNTMRYMTAGALMGGPTYAMYQGWQSAKEFDYQMERARQNFTLKESSGDPEEDKKTADSVSGKEIRLIMQDMAVQFGLKPEEIAKAFHIASRVMGDPDEAKAFTSALAKGAAIEELDVEEGAKGLESTLIQHGLGGFSANKVMDMAIMTANISPATIEDILATQQRSGAMFREALTGMSKEEAVATSMGLGAMFNNATARSGAEGGTFWKAILTSPFKGKTSKDLKEFANQKGFEELNPFTADGKQKNFVDWFSGFLEKSMTLNDEDKKLLWSKVFPQWHTGSAAAIETFMKDMMGDMQKGLDKAEKSGAGGKDTDGDGRIGYKEAMTAYFDRIQNVDPDTINAMKEGTLQTWGKRTQVIGTSFSNAAIEVLAELEDEFSVVQTYLVAFLRGLRENAATIAALIEVGSQVAIGMGAKYLLSNFVKQPLDNMERDHVDKQYGKHKDGMVAQGKAYDMRGQVIADSITNNNMRRADIHSRRAELLSQLGDPNRDKTLADKRERRDKLIQAVDQVSTENRNRPPGTADKGNLAKESNLRYELNKANQEIIQMEASTKKLQRELSELDEEESKVVKQTEKLSSELASNDAQIRKVERQVEELDKAYDEFGKSGDKVSKSIEKLNADFRAGTISANKYQVEIKEMGRDAGMSDAQLSNLVREVDKLNREFQEGAISAAQYVRQLDKLEQQRILGATVPPTGTLNPNTKLGTATATAGGGMVDTFQTGLMGTLMAKSLVGGIGGGVFSKMKKFANPKNFRKQPVYDPNLRKTPLKEFKSGKDIDWRDVEKENKKHEKKKLKRERNLPDVDVDKEDGDIGPFKKMGKARKALGALKAGGKLFGAIGASMAVGSALLDISSAYGYGKLEKHEKAEAKLAKEEDLIDTAANFADAGYGGKFLGALDFANKFLIGGTVNKLFGGPGSSWGEVSEAAGIAISSKDGEEAKKRGAEHFDTKADAKKARELREEYEAEQNEEPDELQDPTKVLEDILGSLDEQTSEVQKINDKMSRDMSGSNAEYRYDSAKLLISGVREDSKEMRDLMKEYLMRNIAILQKTLEEIQAQKSKISDKESDEYKDLESQEKDINAQIAESELQAKETDFAQFDEIMNKLNEDLTMKDYEDSIAESQAKLNGAKDDSAVVKEIKSSGANKENERIEKAQAELRALLESRDWGQSQNQKILQTIASLEAQQNKNLVELKEMVGKTKSTFNLPSGVTPMNYFDYAMKTASHQNITTRAGDVTVNVTVGSMNGTKKDADKLGQSLAEAIRLANQQAAQAFRGGVRAGMGSNL